MFDHWIGSGNYCLPTGNRISFWDVINFVARGNDENRITTRIPTHHAVALNLTMTWQVPTLFVWKFQTFLLMSVSRMYNVSDWSIWNRRYATAWFVACTRFICASSLYQVRWLAMELCYFGAPLDRITMFLGHNPSSFMSSPNLDNYTSMWQITISY